MPPITQLFFLLIIAICSSSAKSAALDFQAGQSDPLSSQYDDSLTNPLARASDTTGGANAEFPILFASNPGSGTPAEAALNKQNEPSLSCSSNHKRDSTKTPAWCKPDILHVPSMQPGSTPPVQEFKLEDLI